MQKTTYGSAKKEQNPMPTNGESLAYQEIKQEKATTNGKTKEAQDTKQDKETPPTTKVQGMQGFLHSTKELGQRYRERSCGPCPPSSSTTRPSLPSPPVTVSEPSSPPSTTTSPTASPGKKAASSHPCISVRCKHKGESAELQTLPNYP